MEEDTGIDPDHSVKDPSELEGDIDDARRALDDVQRVDTDTHESFIEAGDDEETDDTIAPPG